MDETRETDMIETERAARDVAGHYFEYSKKAWEIIYGYKEQI